MRVDGAAGVVAGEEGAELYDAVRGGLLGAAQEGLLVVGLVGEVAVTVGDDAGVDAGRVGFCGGFLV